MMQNSEFYPGNNHNPESLDEFLPQGEYLDIRSVLNPENHDFRSKKSEFKNLNILNEASRIPNSTQNDPDFPTFYTELEMSSNNPVKSTTLKRTRKFSSNLDSPRYATRSISKAKNVPSLKKFKTSTLESITDPELIPSRNSSNTSKHNLNFDKSNLQFLSPNNLCFNNPSPVPLTFTKDFDSKFLEAFSPPEKIIFSKSGHSNDNIKIQSILNPNTSSPRNTSAIFNTNYQIDPFSQPQLSSKFGKKSNSLNIGSLLARPEFGFEGEIGNSSANNPISPSTTRVNGLNFPPDHSKINISDNPLTKYPSDLGIQKNGSTRLPSSSSRKSSRKNTIGAKLNSSSDKKDGHFIAHYNQILGSRYVIKELLGQGTFGKVLKCLDIVSQKLVAVKVIKSIHKYRVAAGMEIKILQTVKSNDPKNIYKCIPINDSFDFEDHVCMVFDLLGSSLYDFLKGNLFQPFPLSDVQKISFQIIKSIFFIHSLNLIHTDLKPENILLVDDSFTVQTLAQRSQLKLLNSVDTQIIDFGSAVFDNEYHPKIVSTRHYRAPEIILELGWSYPCDMWSIGCILVELLTGEALFQTHENSEHLAMIEKFICAPPPSHMIESMDPRLRSEFYDSSNCLLYPNFSTPKNSSARLNKIRSIYDIMGVSNTYPMRSLVDLIYRLLQFDPELRISADEALKHEFFRLEIEKGIIISEFKEKRTISQSKIKPINSKFLTQDQELDLGGLYRTEATKNNVNPSPRSHNYSGSFNIPVENIDKSQNQSNFDGDINKDLFGDLKSKNESSMYLDFQRKKLKNRLNFSTSNYLANSITDGAHAPAVRHLSKDSVIKSSTPKRTIGEFNSQQSNFGVLGFPRFSNEFQSSTKASPVNGLNYIATENAGLDNSVYSAPSICKNPDFSMYSNTIPHNAYRAREPQIDNLNHRALEYSHDSQHNRQFSSSENRVNLPDINSFGISCSSTNVPPFNNSSDLKLYEKTSHDLPLNVDRFGINNCRKFDQSRDTIFKTRSIEQGNLNNKFQNNRVESITENSHFYSNYGKNLCEGYFPTTSAPINEDSFLNSSYLYSNNPVDNLKTENLNHIGFNFEPTLSRGELPSVSQKRSRNSQLKVDFTLDQGDMNMLGNSLNPADISEGAFNSLKKSEIGYISDDFEKNKQEENSGRCRKLAENFEDLLKKVENHENYFYGLNPINSYQTSYLQKYNSDNFGTADINSLQESFSGTGVDNFKSNTNYVDINTQNEYRFESNTNYTPRPVVTKEHSIRPSIDLSSQKYNHETNNRKLESPNYVEVNRPFEEYDSKPSYSVVGILSESGQNSNNVISEALGNTNEASFIHRTRKPDFQEVMGNTSQPGNSLSNIPSLKDVGYRGKFDEPQPQTNHQIPSSIDEFNVEELEGTFSEANRNEKGHPTKVVSARSSLFYLVNSSTFTLT
ncbi:Dual specificity protein kinase lkh1 [Smittium mucronatum]|uniref:Dual specificity protein kinase lkh1 n=1 Tax=Smittium mucronatum TaxID=133383 RepID=A0A1R0H6C6_9FUNG|nr:Dual specificity protein kinase lkh1 [Smittium mucronatum]